MQYLIIIIATLVIYLLYVVINKKVTKSFALKETDINTDLKEFRESHAVAGVILFGSLNTKESIVQRYERMCIIDPLKYQNDPVLPQLIKDYRNIIEGKVLDPQGLNVPSETILDAHNPDYDLYYKNQARVLKDKGYHNQAQILFNEKKRISQRAEEEKVKAILFAQLVSEGIPALILAAAFSDEKLNTYKANDWKIFSKFINGYLETSDRETVTRFVQLFDDKKIILNQNKFDTFAIFNKYQVPETIIVEIINDKITVYQALRMIDLTQNIEYTWKEAMNKVLNDDAEKERADTLRASYGYKE